MYGRFSDAARQAMVTANRQAESGGQKHIGSLHILVGALDSAPAIFDNSLIDAKQLRANAEDLLTTTKSSGAKKVIENAIRHSKDSGCDRISVSHVVLGILTEPDTSVIELFDRTNMNIDAARNHLLQTRQDE